MTSGRRPDRILPVPNTVARLPGLIEDLTFVTVKVRAAGAELVVSSFDQMVAL